MTTPTPAHPQPPLPGVPQPGAPTAPEGPAPTGWQRLRRWVYRGSVVGFVISIWVHLLLWIIAAMIHIPYSNADAGGQGEQVVEFAVMSEIDLTPPGEPDTTAQIPASAASSPSSIEQLDTLADLVGADPDIMSDQQVELSMSVSDLTSSSGTGFDADVTGFGAAGSGAGASFFGLEAQGRRFVYIIDVSGSMDSEAFDNHSRLHVTRSELSRSVSGLLETSEFAILLFAFDSGSLYPRSWIPATERNVIDARARIGSLSTDSDALRKWGINRPQGTDPRDAFEDAFRLRPSADAIYFMTDGEFDETIVEFIANLNRRARMPVHCVLFTETDSGVQIKSEPRMREIARQSGGQYTLVTGRGP